MSLTKVHPLMLEVPLSGILGGENSSVIHQGSFIIGNDITTEATNTLFVNNLHATGKLNGDGSEIQGVAKLNSCGFVCAAQLPGYVEDVIVLSSTNNLTGTGDESKLYLVTENHLLYLWDGTQFIYAATQPSSALPLMNETAALSGSSLFYSREDHVHPTDTSRAPVDSPIFTSQACSPTPLNDSNSECIATTAFVRNLGSSVDPLMNDTIALSGSSRFYSREDHVHPTDTSRAPVDSPTFTSLACAPTPVDSSNSECIATTAFVRSLGSSLDPLMNDTVALSGTSRFYSREDHVHPTDSTRAPVDSPTFTTLACAPTPVDSSNSECIATTAFVRSLGSGSAPLMNDTVALSGTSRFYSREDHVHPTDTSRAPVDSPSFINGAAFSGNVTINGHLSSFGTLTVTDAISANNTGITGLNSLTIPNAIIANNTGITGLNSLTISDAITANNTGITGLNSLTVHGALTSTNLLATLSNDLCVPGHTDGCSAFFNNLSAGLIHGDGANITNLTITQQSLTQAAASCQGSFVLGLNALNKEVANSTPTISGVTYTRSATTVTLTVPVGHNIASDEFINVTLATHPTLNGIYRVLTSGTTTLTFENPETATSSGSANIQKNLRVNIAVGQQALNSLTSGSNNIGIGFDASTGVATSSNSIAIGNNSSADGCAVGIGVKTIADNWGVAVGVQAYGAGSGAAIGYNAQGGNNSVAIGRDASSQGYCGAIVLGREAAACNKHIAVGSQNFPVNNQSATWGKNLEVRVNNGNVGYVPVYDSPLSTLPYLTATDTTKLHLSGGNITGNLNVAGSFTVSGSATFVNTVFSTTSAVSAINRGPGPALYVAQASGLGDIATFCDLDGATVLHVGNARRGDGTFVDGVVGIKTSTPNKTLTVAGEISASQGVYACKFYGDGSSITNISIGSLLSRSDVEKTLQSPTSSVNLGTGSLFNQTATGNCNLALGLSALCAVTTGCNNIGIGQRAGVNITTGVNNISIGNASNSCGGVTVGNSSTGGCKAVVVGNDITSSGICAIAIGANITQSSTGGVAVGFGSNTNGSACSVAIGHGAIANHSTLPTVSVGPGATSTCGGIAIGSGATTSAAHLAVGSSGSPINASAICGGRSLDVNLNGTLGYIPVYSTALTATPLQANGGNISGSLNVSGSVTAVGGMTSTTLSNADSSTGVATTAFVKNQSYITANPANLCVSSSATAPTPSTSNNSTCIATTAFVKNQGYITTSGGSLSLSGTLTAAGICSTGRSVAPTPSLGDMSICIATTEFVKSQGYLTSGGSTGANLTLTGGITGNFACFCDSANAPTVSLSDNSTNIATTAFVKGQCYLSTSGGNLTLTGTLSVAGTTTLGGISCAPTPTNTDSSTCIATTAFVKNQSYITANPTNLCVSSSATAPTASTSDNSTCIATTAFVKNQSYITANPTNLCVSSSACAPTPTNTDCSTCIATTAFVKNQLACVPTATVCDCSNCIATTAFVRNIASTSAPPSVGSACVGTSICYARADHVHPACTATAGVLDNSTCIATTAFVKNQNYISATGCCSLTLANSLSAPIGSFSTGIFGNLCSSLPCATLNSSVVNPRCSIAVGAGALSREAALTNTTCWSNINITRPTSTTVLMTLPAGHGLVVGSCVYVSSSNEDSLLGTLRVTGISGTTTVCLNNPVSSIISAATISFRDISSRNNIAIGSGALRILQSGCQNTSVGTNAGSGLTTGHCNTFVGNSANSSGLGTLRAVAVGSNSNASTDGVAIGDSSSGGGYSVAVGRGATTYGYSENTAVGYSASNFSSYSVSVGSRASSSTSTAIGANSCSVSLGVSIGNDAVAQSCGVSIGSNATACLYGVAIGRATQSNSRSVVIGSNASNASELSIGIGYCASAGGCCAVTIGSYSSTVNENSLVIGACSSVGRCVYDTYLVGGGLPRVVYGNQPINNCGNLILNYQTGHSVLSGSGVSMACFPTDTRLSFLGDATVTRYVTYTDYLSSAVEPVIRVNTNFGSTCTGASIVVNNPVSVQFGHTVSGLNKIKFTRKISEFDQTGVYISQDLGNFKQEVVRGLAGNHINGLGVDGKSSFSIVAASGTSALQTHALSATAPANRLPRIIQMRTISGVTYALASSELADGLFVDGTDTQSPVVVKILANGTIEHIAGGCVDVARGIRHNGDGLKFSAMLEGATGFVTNSDGSLGYVKTRFGIKRVDMATGRVVSIAGNNPIWDEYSIAVDGTGSNAHFLPGGVLTISTDNTTLFILETDRVRKITSISTGSAAVVSTVAGQIGSQALIDGAQGVARINVGWTTGGYDFGRGAIAFYDAATLFIRDASSGDVIRKVIWSGATSGTITTVIGNMLAGSPTDGAGTAAEFNAINSIVIVGTDMYIADNKAIRKATNITTAAPVVSTYISAISLDEQISWGAVPFWNTRLGTSPKFSRLLSITGDATTLYVAEQGLDIESYAGSFSTVVKSITVSDKNTRLIAGEYISSTGAYFGNGRYNYIPATKQMYSRYNVGPRALIGGAICIVPDSVSTPTKLYFIDDISNSIKIFDIFGGTVTTLAGPIGVKETGYIDGTGQVARFNKPRGLALIGTDLYVADTGNHCIRKVTAAGVVSLVAGLSGTAGHAQGTGNVARFNFPSSIWTDGTTLYVGDYSSIRKVSTAGVVTAWIGGANAGYDNGTASAGNNLTAMFYQVSHMTRTPDTFWLLVSDRENNRIRRISLSASSGYAIGFVQDFLGTGNGNYISQGWAAPTGLGTPNCGAPGSMVFEGNNLWFTSGSIVGRMNITNGYVSTFTSGLDECVLAYIPQIRGFFVGNSPFYISTRPSLTVSGIFYMRLANSYPLYKGSLISCSNFPASTEVVDFDGDDYTVTVSRKATATSTAGIGVGVGYASPYYNNYTQPVSATATTLNSTTFAAIDVSDIRVGDLVKFYISAEATPEANTYVTSKDATAKTFTVSRPITMLGEGIATFTSTGGISLGNSSRATENNLALGNTLSPLKELTAAAVNTAAVDSYLETIINGKEVAVPVYAVTANN